MSAAPNLPESVPHIKDSTAEEKNAKVNGNATANGYANGHIYESSFQIHDAPVDAQRPMRVIVIGAGYSGIYCGIRIPERLRNVELAIYEKNAGYGGTWYENRYPGAACDVPSHSYQFSFEPHSQWSHLYAPSWEIQSYLDFVTKKYGADRFIKLKHEVVECRYSDREAKWHVKVKKLDTGMVIEDTCDVLISARGNLNNKAWPEIEGFRSFEGEIMHSAEWNESYDFRNRRIGVIGSGSSSIQIVPKLQQVEGAHLSCFVRNPTWISPPFSAQLLQQLLGSDSMEFTEEQRRKFASDPKYYQQFRLAIEADANGCHAFTLRDTPAQHAALEAFTQNMQERLKTHPHIMNFMLPKFAPGCRRLTPGPGYLEALCKDNVDFVTGEIARIEPKGVVMRDGDRFVKLDALVCATGFHTSAPPPFPVIGRHGLPITKHWDERATNYLSLATDNFPNHWLMLGPNAAIGAGSLTMMIESTGDYIIKCIRKMQKENIASMSVRKERVDDFVEYCDAYFDKTIYTDDCRSWYRNWKGGRDGPVTGLWPGSTLHCIESLRSPRWEDYDYEYVGEDLGEGEGSTVAVRDGLANAERPVKKPKRKRVNRMAWLGNGWTDKQFNGEDLAWYLYPEFLDCPKWPKPEESDYYRIRPFSY